LELKKEIKILHGNFSIYLGNFSVSLDKGIFKSLLFKITQHEKDEVLLIAIKNYLNCGYCYLREKENTIDFKGTKFSDITEIIIPFFINNPILVASCEATACFRMEGFLVFTF
jgi:hypothetical protein